MYFGPQTFKPGYGPVPLFSKNITYLSRISRWAQSSKLNTNMGLCQCESKFTQAQPAVEAFLYTASLERFIYFHPELKFTSNMLQFNSNA